MSLPLHSSRRLDESFQKTLSRRPQMHSEDSSLIRVWYFFSRTHGPQHVRSQHIHMKLQYVVIGFCIGNRRMLQLLYDYLLLCWIYKRLKMIEKDICKPHAMPSGPRSLCISIMDPFWVSWSEFPVVAPWRSEDYPDSENKCLQLRFGRWNIKSLRWNGLRQDNQPGKQESCLPGQLCRSFHTIHYGLSHPVLEPR